MNRFTCNRTSEELRYFDQGTYHSIPYNYSPLSDRILLSSVPLQIQTSLHIMKILRQITKILAMNMFECSLLHYLLVQDSFNHQELENNKGVQQLIQFDQFVYEDRKYSSVFLLILFNGYYIKTFVNKHENISKINNSILRLIPSFIKIYGEWDKKKLLKKISLQDINEVFIKNTFIGQAQQINQNYNDVVDRILQMSKPYNNSNKLQIEQQQDNDSQSQSVVDKKQTKRKHKIVKNNIQKSKIKSNKPTKETKLKKPTKQQLQQPSLKHSKIKKLNQSKSKQQILFKQKQADPIEASNEMLNSLRRSTRIMKKIETPSPYSFEDSIFRGSYYKNNDDMLASRQFVIPNMLSSLQSVGNWNNSNLYQDNNMMRSSYHLPSLLFPQQSSKRQQSQKHKTLGLRQVQSEQQS